MGVERAPWFGDERSSVTPKSRENPRRNAKTRQRSLPGHFANGHLAVSLLVEAAGIEPASRDVFTTTSTCVVVDLVFVLSDAHDRLRRDLARNKFDPQRLRQDCGRSGIDYRFLGLSGEIPQPGLPVYLGSQSQVVVGN
jgi:hypothetical protein